MWFFLVQVNTKSVSSALKKKYTSEYKVHAASTKSHLPTEMQQK